MGNDSPDHAVTNDQRERVSVSRYHAHIPKLVDKGISTFNTGTEMIAPAENANQVLAALAGMGARFDTEQETHARGDMDDTE